MARLPVLMYHRITSVDCPVPHEDAGEMRYSLPLEEFAWQMDRLAASGCRGVAVGEAFDAALQGEAIPDDWVILTFDDGNRSDFVHALPILKDRSYSATFFVGISRIGKEGGLEANMIEGLVSGGMEIGSHGMSHRFLPSLSDGEEMEECVRSKEILNELSGREVRFFALPGGRYKRRTVHALKQCGYSAVCTSNYGYNASLPVFLLKRLPIHSGTARATFDAILTRSVAKLIPEYCRVTAAAIARNILGEKMYGKIRAAGLRG